MNSTIFLIDDNKQICDAVGKLLNMSGLECKSYSSSSAFLDDWEFVKNRAGCMVIDLHLGNESGIDLIRELEHRGCKMPFMMISGKGQISDATKAMRLGAIDFLEKPFEPNVLVQRLMEGIKKDHERWDQSAESKMFLMKLNSLTKREREVMDLVVQGRATKEVSESLGIAVKTVEVHRTHVLKKMGVGSTVELVHLVSKNQPD